MENNKRLYIIFELVNMFKSIAHVEDEIESNL